MKGAAHKEYTQGYRGEAVGMVLENDRPVAKVARGLGIYEGTLGDWVNQYRREHPVSEELSLPDRARLRGLEHENRELRLMNDFLGKVAACFAREQQ